MSRLIPTPLSGRLEAGVYYLHIAAPPAVLDTLARHPEAVQGVARFMVGQLGATYQEARIKRVGDGQVYAVRFEVTAAQAVTVEAGFGARALLLVALAAGVAVGTWAGWSILLYRVDPAAVPGIISDARDTVALIVIGGVVLGGYLVARRIW